MQCELEDIRQTEISYFEGSVRVTHFRVNQSGTPTVCIWAGATRDEEAHQQHGTIWWRCDNCKYDFDLWTEVERHLERP